MVAQSPVRTIGVAITKVSDNPDVLVIEALIMAL
jgi:hypothetical protein